MLIYNLFKLIQINFLDISFYERIVFELIFNESWKEIQIYIHLSLITRNLNSQNSKNNDIVYNVFANKFFSLLYVLQLPVGSYNCSFPPINCFLHMLEKGQEGDWLYFRVNRRHL